MHSQPISLGRAAYLVGIALALILVIPTVWFPFQLTKIAAFALCASAAVVLYLLGGGLRELSRAHGLYAALAIVLLPLAYVLSAQFSTDPSVAFLGFDISVDTVVFTTLAASAFLLSFAYFRTLRTARLLLVVLCGALAAAVIFQWLSIVFGASVIPFETFADRSMNLVGKWNDLGLLVGLLLVFLLSFAELAGQTRFFRVGAATAGAVLVILLGIINLPLAWALILAASLAVLFVKFVVHQREGIEEGGGARAWSRDVPLFSAFVAVVAAVFLFFGATFNVGLTALFPVSSLEVRPSYQSTLGVHMAARENSSGRFLVGTGPNTFGQQWLLHKPREINHTPFWNVDFSVGFSTILTALGTVGFLGVVAWFVPLVLVLVAAGRVVRRSVLSRGSRGVATALVVGSLLLFGALIFYVPSQNIVLLAFTLWGATFGFLWRQGRSTHAEASADGAIPDRRSQLIMLGTGALALSLLVATLVPSGIVLRRFASEVFVNRGMLALQEQDLGAASSYAARAAAIEQSGNALRLAATAAGTILVQIAQDAALSPEQARERFEATLEQAITAGTQAAQLNRGDYRPHLILARVYDFLTLLGVDGAYDAALVSYGQAQQRNPQNPAIPLLVGRLEAARGNIAQAREHVTHSLTLKPNFTDAILFTVQLDVAREDISSAIQAAAAAAATAPGVAPIWFQLGLLYYAVGESANALAALERAVSLVGDYANAKYFLGLSYYQEGRTEEAIRQFEDLVRSNPDNEEVALILDNLRSGKAPFEGAQPPITPEPQARSVAPIEE